MISSAMLSIALTFSSTIVVVKSLSEGKDLSSFVGRLSLGILLLQDLLAIVLLALIPGFKDGLSVSSLEILVAKILLILFVVNLVGHYVISWLMKYFVKSTEDLVLFSLVWFFLSVYFSTNVLKLTPEIGGILAGISLSSSWGHFQIVSKVKTLRDIFLTIFFVLLGLEVGVEPVNWLLVLYIVAMILLVKFLISGFAALFSGLKRRVAFAVGLNMTQISEFSLIVLTIGLSASLWGNSMVLSTILISNSSKLYKSFSRKFPKLFSNERREGKAVTMSGHIILLGGDRTGRSILSFLKKNRELVLIVDFNPEIIKHLKVKGEEAIFADASDPDVIELTNMVEAKMVISTVKDIHDSLALLTEMRLKGIKVPAIVDAESASQAAELYEAGASYVIFPHFVSGLHLGQLMKKFEKDSETLNHYRLRQNETLKEIYEGEF
ncbi:MAG: Transporter, CPA2 family [Candidatus Collierbacteria bacterium GW2011_GWB1_44_6]|uniref:Transporter, CPA2 family n=1 Tax=Candidatus Collierbacteria bacterium GW2011_GWB1_44_6 TaxID=1618384 RepID=A0A0G1JJD4_9BACT|nr:MAG: Transporter, CPA2 family [Candidatus Collierbacteria bacterium GW2011_GWB1_44_6]